ncbi:MAG: efflux RND transporter periplasmic adaptor subunit [Candidatus Aminicenantia bacterium]
MNIKKKFKIFSIIGLIFLVIIIFFSCKKGEPVSDTSAPQKVEKEKKILYWTCGMHPSVRVSPEDYEKGNTKCPICNMDLVPVYEGAEISEEEGVVTQLKLSPRAQALAKVRTAEVTYHSLFKEINTVGQMDYDERKVAYVAAWISGRIDKLFVDFTGVEVKKEEPLVWIYSPNLVTTQDEYLLALETLQKVKESNVKETIEGAQSLVEASKKRLLLWGINENQIKELEKRKKAETHMTIYAPIGGTVIHKNALEGKYVKEGENLYKIADLSNLWMLADIYEYEMSWIKVGQKVEITTPTYPGEVFEGTISFINPFLNQKTRSVKIRVDVPNPQLKLKPGMYVNALIKIPIMPKSKIQNLKSKYTCPMHPEIISDKPGECPICGMYLVKKKSPPQDKILAVLKDAVLDTGTRKMVYIDKGEGIYIGKEVKVGPEAIAIVNGKKEKFYLVLEGLSEGDIVVSRANFLIDSQSQITGGAEAVYGGAIEAEEKGEKKKPTHQH